MEGNIAEARRKYDEALALSKVIGYSEGAQQSAQALKRLSNS